MTSTSQRLRRHDKYAPKDYGLDKKDGDGLLERETFAMEAKLKKKNKSSKKRQNDENDYDNITNPEFVSPRSDSNRFATIEKSLTYLQA